MHLKSFAHTDLQVSELCLGTMTWGNQNTEQQAHEQMDYALEQGINFFDTAELYAVPPSPETTTLTEHYIGSWFKKTGKREEIVLASKISGGGLMRGHFNWIRNAAPINANNMRLALEGSLKRLETDYLDLYQLHAPNRDYPHHGKHWGGKIDYKATTTNQEIDNFVEILETAKTFVQEGKIRYLGLSNDSVWGLMKMLQLSETQDLPRIASMQNEYSLLYRVDEPYMAETLIRENIAYLPYSPLGGGMLSGKYLGGARPEGSRWSLDTRPNVRDTKNAQEAISAYMNIAERHGLDVCQMALQFVTTRPFVTSTIIGATSMEQLQRDVDSVKIPLSDEILSEIENVYIQYPQPY